MNARVAQVDPERRFLLCLKGQSLRRRRVKCVYNEVMLLTSAQLQNLEVTSLQTGQPIGQTLAVIIDPFKLRVAGFYLDANTDNILLAGDMRELSPQRILINSTDVLTNEAELPRLAEVLAMNYELVGKKVMSRSKQRLGSVEAYVIDTLNTEIQKLHVRQPLLRSFSGGTLIVDRRQIVEINDRMVIVEDAAAQKPAWAGRKALSRSVPV